jgi:hypothetical protein
MTKMLGINQTDFGTIEANLELIAKVDTGCAGRILPCGEESSEEHSQSYVTSERQSRKAKEPRPFGLLFQRRLAALLLRSRCTAASLPQSRLARRL